MSKFFPLHTSGAIAKELEMPIEVVEYILRTHRINPPPRAGNARMYTGEQVLLIARIFKTTGWRQK